MAGGGGASGGVAGSVRAHVSGARVLVVEDEALFARAVVKRLGRDGLLAEAAGTLADARAALAAQPADAVLLDMRLPDGSGMSLLPELGTVPVMVLTAFAGLEDAVAAMKAGANDYLTKPVDLDQLAQRVADLLAAGPRPGSDRALTSEHARQQPAEAAGVELLGASPAMLRLRAEIEHLHTLVANGGEPPSILILGETGTGKDVVARCLASVGHPAGSESPGSRPFVHVDCAALPKGVIEAELFGHARGAFTSAHAARTGLIEAAGAGILFLDEVGELPLDVQSRLLAVLERRRMRRVGATEETPVPAWFIAATNRDLKAMVAAGDFRADLFYRLEVMRLELPPLRERGDDVALLARHYVTQRAQRRGLTPVRLGAAAEAALAAHPWPGNVRELVNVVERALLRCTGDVVEVADLGLAPGAPAQLEATAAAVPSLQVDASATLQQAERRLIEQALEAANGNVSAAARQLGVSRMTLRYRIEKFGIHR